MEELRRSKRIEEKEKKRDKLFEIEKLPEELKLMIFGKLSPIELCQVILVSKSFYQIGATSILWKKTIINQNRLLAVEGWKKSESLQFFNLYRFSKVECLNLELYWFEVEQLNHVLVMSLYSNITELVLNGKVIAKVPITLLERSIFKIKILNLNYYRFVDKEKLKSLFIACSNSKTLEELYLNNINISSLSLILLKKTIMSLKKIKISGYVDDLAQPGISSWHIKAIHDMIYLSSSLIEISLPYMNFNKLPLKENLRSNVLSSINSSIKKIDLSGNNLCEENLELLLKFLIYNHLDEIDLSNCTYLKNINPKLFSRGITSVKKVSLWGYDQKLTKPQLIKLFKKIKNTSTKIQDIDLGDISLKKIPIKLLVNAIIKLKIVDISRGDLKWEKKEKIFTKMLDDSCQIKTLKITYFPPLSDQYLYEKLKKKFHLGGVWVTGEMGKISNIISEEDPKKRLFVLKHLTSHR